MILTMLEQKEVAEWIEGLVDETIADGEECKIELFKEKVWDFFSRRDGIITADIVVKENADAFYSYYLKKYAREKRIVEAESEDDERDWRKSRC